jgi:hypothetical protein
MMLADILRKIKSELKTQRNQIANDMVDGRMSDQQEYQRNVGVAKGIDIACNTIDETIKQINEEDE